MKTRDVKFGKRLFPVDFPSAALMEFEEMTGINLLKGTAEFNATQTLALCFVGCKHGAISTGGPFEYDFKSFANLINIVKDAGQIERVAEIYSVQYAPADEVKPGQQGEAKGV